MLVLDWYYKYYFNLVAMDTRCVVGKIVFKIEGISSQVFEWKEYHLKIRVQEKTLPENESCEITVKVLFGGMFKLSKGKLISFIYDIYVSKQLLKPVKLTIPHYAYLVTQDQTPFLSFVKASIDESVRPCEFKLEKGQFYCNKPYGKISLSESCIIAVAKLSPDHLRQVDISDEQLLSESSDDDKDVNLSAELEHSIRRLSSASQDECFLVCRSMLETSNFPACYNKFDPLLLRWNQNLPPTFFPKLVTKLHQSTEFSNAPPESGKVMHHSSRNIISLMCTNFGGKVLLVETDHLIEIHYSGEPKDCCFIREAIVKEVKVVVSDFSGMENLKEEFYCKICNTTEHACSLNLYKTIITCPYDGGTRGIDQKRQLPWFKPGIQSKFFL